MAAFAKAHAIPGYAVRKLEEALAIKERDWATWFNSAKAALRGIDSESASLAGADRIVIGILPFLEDGSEAATRGAFVNGLRLEAAGAGGLNQAGSNAR